ncbi:MAG: o-succinylbenzoate--CoA ligase [Gemmatimonadetes bacterium]|nr:MAG: o-succinylbenzoate--CoA ligase [Gemmatimonadota bacterium]
MIYSNTFSLDHAPFEALTVEVADHLQSTFGLHAGDRVGICAPNRPEYGVLLFALFRLGVVAVPLNWRFPPSQMLDLLDHTGVNILFFDPVRSVSFDVPQIVTHPLPDIMPTQRLPKKSCQPFGFLDRLDQPATLIFTSGSSGVPKAALHTIGNHVYSALGSNQNIPFGAGDRWLLSLPLFHVGGLAILFRAWVGGGSVVIPDSEHDLSQSIEMFEVTHLSLVATQLYRLLAVEAGIRALKRLKAILLGGSAIPSRLIRQAVDLNLPVYTSYGSTEMASQITTTQPGDSLDRLLTSGKVLAHRQLRIADDGEILVRGKTLFQGYVRGDQLHPARDGNGWFHSGDVGKLDEQGYLVVTGRRDNLFISGGENIQPEEIEQALREVTGVVEAVVVPVDHPEFGKRPVAFLQFSETPLPADVLRAELAKKIARFKIPDDFYPFPARVPQTGIKRNRAFFQDYAESLKA